MDQRLSGYNNSKVNGAAGAQSEPVSLALETADSGSLETACPKCGMTRRELYAEGRMGCVECYRVFEAEVLHALKEIHGAVRHGESA
jgi:protein-arginine kinase activator protein McsA